jgi:hypothetical protein
MFARFKQFASKFLTYHNDLQSQIASALTAPGRHKQNVEGFYVQIASLGICSYFHSGTKGKVRFGKKKRGG